MDPLDILYTPLATAPIPKFDQGRLLDWVRENQNQRINQRRDASLKTQRNIYPWDITYPIEGRRWRNGFDNEFPVLSEFFHAAYGLDRRDLHTVVLLPVRSDFVGEGFWHSDPDETGLRMYLENTEADKDFLLIKASRQPLTSRDPDLVVAKDGQDPAYSDDIYSARVLQPQQVFFLNNIRAIHSANVSTPGAFRIAVIVTIGKDYQQMPAHLKQLIVDSANQYKDLAVFRQV